MFGGGIRKDDGLPAISSTNIFAALESRKRKSTKKRSEKDKSSSKSENQQPHHRNGDADQFWSPTPVTLKKSWADVEEEDDDDYYATTAPPPIWSSLKAADNVPLHEEQSNEGEESEGDEEIEEEVEDDAQEEIDGKASDVTSSDSGLPIQAAPTPVLTREPDRQLSKKERKKKELAELDAVLAELGLDKKNFGSEPSPGGEVAVKVEDNGNLEPKGNKGDIPVLTESKSFKKKKPKKEKSFKAEKNGEISVAADPEPAGKDEAVGSLDDESTTLSADPKEVLKKLASLKKKKSMKDSDAAAKAAAAEAAVRAAKLAAAKKKEKHHYNQQPA